jgi:hypothetical protein
MLESAARWEERCRQEGVYWRHRGGTAPHLVLPGTREHVDTYLDYEKLLEHPTLLQLGAQALVWQMGDSRTFDIDRIKRVVGVGRGGSSLAHAVAFKLSVKRSLNPPCLSSALENSPGMIERRSASQARIEPGERVLIAMLDFSEREASAALAEVERRGAWTAPYVAALFNSTNFRGVSTYRSVSVVDYAPMRWASEGSCPLCEQGSEAVKPVTKEDWARLMGE